MKPELFVGIDLTDSYAREPREVDVAILDGKTGGVEFRKFGWPGRDDSGWVGTVARRVAKFRDGATVYVVDGPQALALPQNNTRDVERHLRTPAHTPWQVPAAGTRPFAGYIRTSIDFFNALAGSGFILAELDGVPPTGADLFEAYPGAAWPVLHLGPGALHSKSTLDGRTQRRAMLEGIGCNFKKRKALSHDELDAALCAALGWHFFDAGNGRGGISVELVRPPTPPVAPAQAVFRDGAGILREGRMLMPVRVRGQESSTATKVAATDPPRTKALPPRMKDQLPRSDWVYFAARARASPAETYDLAEQEELITRSAYNETGQRISNVQHLVPGQSVLVMYSSRKGGGNPYRPLFVCVIDEPSPSVQHGHHHFQGLEVADPILTTRLEAVGYEADPVLKQHTIIPIREIQDLQEVTQEVDRPSVTTIRHWEDVFP